MTKRVPGIICALAVAGLSLVSVVPNVSARDVEWRESSDERWRDDGRDRDDEYGRHDRNGRGGRYGRGSERSYYYEDPYCGRRSSHISDFKGHYHRTRHQPLIVKIDIRTGTVLNRYRYDHDQQEWRDWDRRYRSDRDDRRYDTWNGRIRARDRDD